MEKLNCIIADDEPLALDLIRFYIERVPFLNLVKSCSNAYEVLEVCNSTSIDLAFLDIQMPDINGMQLAHKIDSKIMIVFTTAFENYAIEGYKVNTIDYLLKPFNFEEFYDAVIKAKNMFIAKNEASISSNKQYIFIKTEYRIEKIEFEDILYIEGLKDYVKIYLQNQINPVLCLISMKSISETLPHQQFMRVHRSFIVNLSKIKTIERSRIIFGNTFIPVSDNYKEQFRDFVRNQLLE
ncbi:MAG: LytTR family DNA-binding domain-containing protein [Bacteroidetes bacterium]|nr:LytTR family DNA-binding domain-containing protein [Bacteroidota bacterium]